MNDGTALSSSISSYLVPGNMKIGASRHGPRSVARDSRPDNNLERLAGDAVAACGGDLKATIKALVADNIDLQRELDFASLAMSYGFLRGWFAPQREARADADRDGEDGRRS
ncbi:hypothetical protein [Mesorhizobium sp. J428]|uniref:hypothetical protein n=1 Tax=Mesorhizobium sp. J428 TaxID=2898440 RepID=UPI002150EFF7|nr:hypothetical protein [Mesorhizobium sp. J428]MCR5857203.1 hypothetical protein [Mesorhizobium sp. J428]